MKGLHDKVTLGVLTKVFAKADIASTQKGCTNPPLFDAVPVSNFVVPILHLEIGVGNKMLDTFMEWIDERVELITDEERQARES